MNVKSAQQGGIIRTCWPGRLEVLKKEPLFYRDGAHNPDGAKKLAAFLQKYFQGLEVQIHTQMQFLTFIMIILVKEFLLVKVYMI